MFVRLNNHEGKCGCHLCGLRAQIDEVASGHIHAAALGGTKSYREVQAEVISIVSARLAYDIAMMAAVVCDDPAARDRLLADACSAVSAGVTAAAAFNLNQIAIATDEAREALSASARH